MQMNVRYGRLIRPCQSGTIWFHYPFFVATWHHINYLFLSWLSERKKMTVSKKCDPGFGCRIEPWSSCTRGVCATDAPLHIHFIDNIIIDHIKWLPLKFYRTMMWSQLQDLLLIKETSLQHLSIHLILIYIDSCE